MSYTEVRDILSSMRYDLRYEDVTRELVTHLTELLASLRQRYHLSAHEFSPDQIAALRTIAEALSVLEEYAEIRADMQSLHERAGKLQNALSNLRTREGCLDEVAARLDRLRGTLSE